MQPEVEPRFTELCKEASQQQIRLGFGLFQRAVLQCVQQLHYNVPSLAAQWLIMYFLLLIWLVQFDPVLFGFVRLIHWLVGHLYGCLVCFTAHRSPSLPS